MFQVEGRKSANALRREVPCYIHEIVKLLEPRESEGCEAAEGGAGTALLGIREGSRFNQLGP